MMVNRLIFEGDDDKHVVMNLLHNHRHNGERLDGLFAPKAKDGVETLINTLNEELKATDLGTLGVILDADTNLADQWARVTRVLNAHGCRNIPSAPSTNGTIVVTKDGKKIGIWVMPDNQQSGALEDFVGSLIAHGDDLWDKAKEDVNNIPESQRRFRPTYLSKAQVHTWLAWQEEPGTRMGGAFKRQYLDPHCPQAAAFVDWIKRLLA
ncbi:MAG: hypothetical protein LBD82_08250 [Deltaproteobacteria bacterium]|jgi:hypothetical protein|nr:hypothetical protein [Deltaproteobacteria bacterium]